VLARGDGEDEAMTVSCFALHRTPDDPAGFEEKCFRSHVPLLEETPVCWRTGCTG
jgi:hypothetical protein